MIVIGILAFVGSVTVFGIRKMSQEQSALNEMDKAVNELRTVIDLMMMANLDSEVRFSRKDNHIQMEMLPKSGVSAQVAPLIPKKPLILDSINQVTFIDGIQKTHITDKITLHFFSKGFLMNRGVLTFTSGNTKGSVIFYGYPTILTLTTGEPPEYPADTAILDLVQKATEQTRAETIPSEAP
jgi:hypothetical protein